MLSDVRYMPRRQFGLGPTDSIDADIDTETNGNTRTDANGA